MTYETTNARDGAATQGEINPTGSKHSLVPETLLAERERFGTTRNGLCKQFGTVFHDASGEKKDGMSWNLQENETRVGLNREMIHSTTACRQS